MLFSTAPFHLRLQTVCCGDMQRLFIHSPPASAGYLPRGSQSDGGDWAEPSFRTRIPPHPASPLPFHLYSELSRLKWSTHFRQEGQLLLLLVASSPWVLQWFLFLRFRNMSASVFIWGCFSTKFPNHGTRRFHFTWQYMKYKASYLFFFFFLSVVLSYLFHFIWTKGCVVVGAQRSGSPGKEVWHAFSGRAL